MATHRLLPGLAALLGVALVGCEGVLGIEVLPSPRADVDGGAGGGAQGCASDAGVCECVPKDERCTEGNGHARCSDAGRWEDAPCPEATPVCSGASCTSVARLAGGLGDHLCAVLTDGTVRCWGRNAKEQIGAPFEGEYATVPQRVAGVTDVQNGATGRRTTCVALADGSGTCWGDNEDAQLGGGPSGPATGDPVAVQLADIDEVAAGSLHTCARTHAGAVHCWGNDDYGQLGHGTVGAPAVAPGPPVDLTGPATDLCSGSVFSCAIVEGAAMWCWGSRLGDLPQGMPGSSGTPFPIPLSGVTQIACGSEHACAQSASGVHCWGNNDSGQTGEPTTLDPPSPVVVNLPVGPEVAQLCAGWRHSCARRKDGLVLCWGRNSLGDLGTGEIGTTFNPLPSFVVGLPAPALDLQCHWRGACALLDDGTVRCWGQADVGQLGNGMAPDSSSTPVPVVWSE